jgi:hypothetical protein
MVFDERMEMVYPCRRRSAKYFKMGFTLFAFLV